MAISRAVIASVFLSLFFILFVHSEENVGQLTPNSVSGGSISKSIDCGGSCKARCFLSKRPNLCKRACRTCCTRCNCVPTGTYGNYDSCACYANMTTRGNKKKCP